MWLVSQEGMVKEEPLIVPPSNPEAEQSVLGSIMLDNSRLDLVREVVRPQDFYRASHATIFTAMADMEGPIDLLTLGDFLSERGQLEAVGGQSYLMEIVSEVVTSANAVHHAQLVKNEADKRACLVLSQNIAGLVEGDTDVSTILTRIHSFDVWRGVNTGMKLDEASVNYMHSLDKRIDKQGLSGVPTGITKLDDFTDGLYGLCIIGGLPSHGKTSLAINIIREAAFSGFRPHIVTLETDYNSLLMRMVSIETGVGLGNLRRGQVDTPDYTKVMKILKQFRQENNVTFDNSDNLDDVCLSIRKAHRDGCRVAMIDYIQLITGKQLRTLKSEPRMEVVSKTLKRLTIELNMPIIALSQLNRSLEDRPWNARIPRKSDLRYSGTIEAAAEVILMLSYRARYSDALIHNPPDNRNEIWLVKNKEGAAGWLIDVGFEPTIGRFYDLTEEEAERMKII